MIVRGLSGLPVLVSTSMQTTSRKSAEYPRLTNRTHSIVKKVPDISGNDIALEAVLDDQTLETDTIICTGNIVGYRALPAECIDIFHNRTDHVVEGNHEAMIEPLKQYIHQETQGQRCRPRFVASVYHRSHLVRYRSKASVAPLMAGVSKLARVRYTDTPTFASADAGVPAGRRLVSSAQHFSR